MKIVEYDINESHLKKNFVITSKLLIALNDPATLNQNLKKELDTSFFIIY